MIKIDLWWCVEVPWGVAVEPAIAQHWLGALDSTFGGDYCCRAPLLDETVGESSR